MSIKIGEWEIDLSEGYIGVSFPLGEHNVTMFYSNAGMIVQHFVQVDIDNKKLARIDLPESEHVNPS